MFSTSSETTTDAPKTRGLQASGVNVNNGVDIAAHCDWIYRRKGSKTLEDGRECEPLSSQRPKLRDGSAVTCDLNCFAMLDAFDNLASVVAKVMYRYVDH